MSKASQKKLAKKQKSESQKPKQNSETSTQNLNQPKNTTLKAATQKPSNSISKPILTQRAARKR